MSPPQMPRETPSASPACVAGHSGSPTAAPLGLCALSGLLMACDLSTVKSITGKRLENNLRHLKEAGVLEGGMGLKYNA